MEMTVELLFFAFKHHFSLHCELNKATIKNEGISPGHILSLYMNNPLYSQK